MLTIGDKQLNSVFERIIKDKNGILVRVRFTVVEINGAFQGQIISAEPLISKIREEIKLLSFTEKVYVIINEAVTLFKSLLFPSFSLEFFMSQPTRAPSNR